MLTVNGNIVYFLILLSALVAFGTSYMTVFSWIRITALDRMTSLKKKHGLLWLISILLCTSFWAVSFLTSTIYILPLNAVINGMTIVTIMMSLGATYLALRIVVTISLKRMITWMASAVLSCIILMANIFSQTLITNIDFNWWQIISLFVASVLTTIVIKGAIQLVLCSMQQHKRTLYWRETMLISLAQLIIPYTLLGENALSFDYSPYAVTLVEQYKLISMLQLTVTIVVVIILINVMYILLLEKQSLKEMAHSDPLTGLPNRHALNHYIEQKYAQNNRFALLFLDLDQFKWINDTLGHDIGDLLIQEVGHRIRLTITQKSEIFRFGGDEFLIVTDTYEREQAEQLAERLLDAIRLPFHLNNNELYVTGSIGISYSPTHGNTMQKLLKTADTALYYAKDLGKNQYCSYDDELNKKLMRKMEIEKGLCAAYLYQQIELHYQPKWNALTNRPVGFEALLRWTHQGLGAISPLEFIPMAEKTGLIVPLTKWVLERACEDCVDWNRKADTNYSVSVNISYKVIESRNLYAMVNQALDKYGLAPHLLELEVNELAMMQDGRGTVEQLKQLQQLGVKITMDNFGAGYTFFGSLDHVPFHTLKIDRKYIGNLQSPSKQAIVNSLVTLSQQLNLQIIAGGVENERQLQFLQQAGCHIMQGYYFQHPISRKELYVWLDQIA
ncbi:putative bifunctional diguanylate cyclase/phosphodiesterase [Paenibacillus yanchengensis]|uniref:Bifunctional diguanylate cyclase/phosphodiesterase n=1 Tax=Paenibacillus yanchengensis TaxID=2035833 RepID=A0ABW4YG86_9BACL